MSICYASVRHLSMMAKAAGIRAYGTIVAHEKASPELQVRQRTDGGVQYNPSVVEDFLEFGNSFASSMLFCLLPCYCN
jgi:hypothetical protein